MKKVALHFMTTPLHLPPLTPRTMLRLLSLAGILAALTSAISRAGESVLLQAVDIRGDCRGGVPESRGETRQSEGTIEMTAHGTEFGHHCGEDQGHFAYAEMKGDFDVSVQITALSNHGATRPKGQLTPAKGGLMVRESNDPAARYVAIWAVSNDDPDHYPDAYHFDARLDPAAWLGSEPEGRFVYGYINRKKHGDLFVRNFPNVWVRLKRDGKMFSAFISRDGKTWSPTSTPGFSIDLPPVLQVGVALSSSPEGKTNARSTATFTNLKGFLVGRGAR